uniref:Tribytltin binding protein type 2b n=1 Tax=Tetraodon nigroviridis TaxID=99883 RepID=H3C4T7_TETNG
MAVVKPAVLLLMLAVLSTRAAPPPEGCHNLTKTVTKAHLERLSGDWVLLWSSSGNTTELEMWRNLTSSHVELKLHKDTITYNERNLFLGNSCVSYYSNMSATSEDQQVFSIKSSMVEMKGALTEEFDNGTVKFFETCDDCLVMEYTGDIGRFLLNYRREGLHQDLEVLKAARSAGQKLAECLGFPPHDPFIYDGVADFCHKKSSPEVKPEQS